MDASGYVKITDFGLSKNYMGTTTITADSFVGTAEYFAPEMITGGNYNNSIDFWSLGILLFEMLTGDTPFKANDTEELFQKIQNENMHIPSYLSDEAASLVQGLCNHSKEERLCDFSRIKSHRFFDGFDWNALQAKKLKPPIKPFLKHGQDLRYFDKSGIAERNLYASELNVTITASNKYAQYSYQPENSLDEFNLS